MCPFPTYINGDFPASTSSFHTCPRASTDPERWCHLEVSPVGSNMISVPPRPNGTLPGSVEIQNNTIYFKGPVSYSVAGTYVCEATNAIGTRSGLVEVNVTGRTAPGLLCSVEKRWGGRQRWEQLHLLHHAVSFQGGNLLREVGHWGSWLCAGVALVCCGFSPFLSWSFFFLTPTQFVPPLSSALDSEIVVHVNRRGTSGRYCSEQGAG